MKCSDARQRWHRRLDKNGLDAELDRHLATCAECRGYAARMQRLVGLMDELRDDTELLTSPVTDAGIHATPRRRREWMTPSARNLMRIAAAIVITVGVGLWYGREPNPTALVRRTMIAPPAPGITLRAESHDRFIAIAAPSAEPNVQTFWLYPSVTVTERRDRSQGPAEKL